MVWNSKKFMVVNSAQKFFCHFHFVSNVNSISGLSASTTILKYGPKILIVYGPTKGGEGMLDPVIVKAY